MASNGNNVINIPNDNIHDMKCDHNMDITPINIQYNIRPLYDINNNGNEKVAQQINKFGCNICEYYTNKKSSIDKHITTQRHIIATNNAIKVADINKKYICESCDKCYNNRSGLWKHKQKCNLKQSKIFTSNNANDVKTIVNTMNNDDELKKFLIEQNNEFKAMILEQNKQNNELTKQIIEMSTKPTTTNNTH